MSHTPVADKPGKIQCLDLETEVLVMEGSLPLTVNSSILEVFDVEGMPSG